MHTSDIANFEFIPPEKSKYRGLVVEAKIIKEEGLSIQDSQTQITFPSKWRTITQVTLKDRQIHMVATGHLYAREAETFDVPETLQLLGRIYLNEGIEAARVAIGGGMFALFIFDCLQSKIHILGDLLACIPLFYAVSDDSVTFATNQFDLLQGRRLSTVACLEYLRFGYLPFSYSVFEDVKRLGPGQVATVHLNSPGIHLSVTDEKLPAYPTINERIHDSNKACRELDRVLTRYFSRLRKEPIAFGLSGGYDSRLIAAYTQHLKAHIVTFNYPGTPEADIARQVSRQIGNPTHVFDIPSDSPSRYAEDFSCGMQTLDSLESSHVFSLLDSLMQGHPAYVIDGFFGDANFGGYYYYKLHGGIEPIERVLSLQDKYDEKLRSIDEYVRICSAGVGRTIELNHTGKAISYSLLSEEKLKGLISQQMDCCHSHADMIEMLKYRFRGRCMIACGPVTFLRRVHTLCPYYDTDVLRTSMSIDKNLRAGDRVYNALWRYRFPELANIPKENTGGRATQTDFAYRMTHFRNALMRKIGERLPIPGRSPRKAGGDIEDFGTQYLANQPNRDFFDRVLRNAQPRLKEGGVDNFFSKIKNNLSGPLYMRLASLAALLSDPDE